MQQVDGSVSTGVPLTGPPVDTRGPASLRAYARRRGVSVQAVSKAVAMKRLRASIVLVKGVPKVADVELADREWTSNTDLVRASPTVKARAAGAPDAPSTFVLTQELAREKHWKAKRAEIDFKEKAGQLVDGEKARSWIVDKFGLVRSRLLAVPSKAKLALPHLPLADVLTLDRLIRETLEELAAEASPAAVPTPGPDAASAELATEGAA